MNTYLDRHISRILQLTFCYIGFIKTHSSTHRPIPHQLLKDGQNVDNDEKGSSGEEKG